MLADPERRSSPVFAAIVIVIVALDLASKWLVTRTMTLYQRTDVIDGFFRLEFIRNRGAAFGLLNNAEYARWVFLILTLGALLLLIGLYRKTETADRLRVTAIAMVVGGAVGNLFDRLRGPDGVVDFFSFGIGERWRFAIFNVADIGVSIGAILLALSFWLEERRNREAKGS